MLKITNKNAQKIGHNNNAENRGRRGGGQGGRRGVNRSQSDQDFRKFLQKKMKTSIATYFL